MKEVRCNNCNKLLAKEKELKGLLEVKCTRCNQINVIKK